MKFSITLKDPDGVYDCVRDAVSVSLRRAATVSDDERKALEAARREELEDFIRKWVEYGEYVTIDFDTEANTASVRVRK